MRKTDICGVPEDTANQADVTFLGLPLEKTEMQWDFVDTKQCKTKKDSESDDSAIDDVFVPLELNNNEVNSSGILKKSPVISSSESSEFEFPGASRKQSKARNRVSFLITEDSKRSRKSQPRTCERLLLPTRIVTQEEIARKNSEPKTFTVERSTLTPSYCVPVEMISLSDSSDCYTSSESISMVPLVNEDSSLGGHTKRENVITWSTLRGSSPVSEEKKAMRLDFLSGHSEAYSDSPQGYHEVFRDGHLSDSKENIDTLNHITKGRESSTNVKIVPQMRKSLVPATYPRFEKSCGVSSQKSKSFPKVNAENRIKLISRGSGNVPLPRPQKLLFLDSKTTIKPDVPPLADIRQNCPDSSTAGRTVSPSSRSIFSGTYTRVLTPSQMKAREAWRETQRKKARLKEEFFKVPYEECNKAVIMGTMGWRRCQSLPRFTTLKSELRKKNISLAKHVPSIQSPVWGSSNRAASPEIIRKVTKDLTKGVPASKTGKENESVIENFWKRVDSFSRGTSVNIHMKRSPDISTHHISLKTEVSKRKPSVLVRRFKVKGITTEAKLEWLKQRNKDQKIVSPPARSYRCDFTTFHESDHSCDSRSQSPQEGIRPRTPEWSNACRVSYAGSTSSGCFSGSSSSTPLSSPASTRNVTPAPHSRHDKIVATPTEL